MRKQTPDILGGILNVKPQLIAIADIRTDGGTQARRHINGETVDDYADAMIEYAINENGATFPPVVIFYDGSDHWLADGFHRIAAAKIAGLDAMEATVKMGSVRDAVLYACGANADHGLRRTNEDKQRAVLRLLEDPEWAEWSDREIARRCNVSDPFVGKLRKSIFTANISSDRTYTTKHGTTAIMKTGGINADRTTAAGNEFDDIGPGEILTFHDNDPVEVLEAKSGDNLRQYRGKCVICGRPLTDADSVNRGMGNVCAAHAARDADIEDAKTPAQLINQDSGDVEYYTPAEIVDAARRLMGTIDLDPASSESANAIVKAGRIFTIDDNGLAQAWAGKVWMNHPFSKENNQQWPAKLINEYEIGSVDAACCITFAATSELWFRPLMQYPQCYLSPRTNYRTPSGDIKPGVTRGSVVTYFGNDIDGFYREFCDLGSVMIPARFAYVEGAQDE